MKQGTVPVVHNDTLYDIIKLLNQYK